jgi:indolepyruvate ferredoxin oxidoreductase
LPGKQLTPRGLKVVLQTRGRKTVKSTLRDVSLGDKYVLDTGTVFINGIQALVRLPVLQRQRDKAQGLNTAGFITGYRGSPLGAYDAELLRQKSLLDGHNIVFQPGVNEDLAATSVHGSQQLISVPDAVYDGVFSIWYAKGPGVDRSGDAFKHGNVAGVHPNGGVLVVYGDDHPGKSSTVAHQSEQALAANLIPSLYPANVAEFFEFGLFGWALSRYAGTWVGFKTVNETVEQTATVNLDLGAIHFTSPEPGELPEEGVHYRGGPYNPGRDEEILVKYRIPLVRQFVRANGIDRVTQDSTQR